jgi:hypothetical protein
MKRKRLSHQAEVICQMFCGWRLQDDLPFFIENQSGQLRIDLLKQTTFFNDGALQPTLLITKTISDWLFNDWQQHQINTEDILYAELEVAFHYIHKSPPVTQSHGPTTHLTFTLSSSIVTEGRRYTKVISKEVSYEHSKPVKKKLNPSHLKISHHKRQIEQYTWLHLYIEGIYYYGSLGNTDEEYMQEQIATILEIQKPKALLVDLTGLEYKWGNAIGKIFKQLLAKELPFAVLIGEKSSGLDNEYMRIISGCKFYNQEQQAIDELLKIVKKA